ncbi:MAG: hypothetical protein KA020_04920 [Planctomycetes bacterium]|nr:hypothetical protein [Planctomycetota bacterium]
MVGQQAEAIRRKRPRTNRRSFANDWSQCHVTAHKLHEQIPFAWTVDAGHAEGERRCFSHCLIGVSQVTSESIGQRRPGNFVTDARQRDQACTDKVVGGGVTVPVTVGITLGNLVECRP